MKVRISNLPEAIDNDDIRELLDNSDDIRGIELMAEGDDESPVAIVDMENDAAAEGAIQLLNGRNWKGSMLRVDKLLY